MRKIITATVFLLVPTAAFTQPPTSYQGQEVDVGQKQIVVNEKSQNFQNARSQYITFDDTVKKQESNFNQKVDKLNDEREQWLARHQIYDNVISLRSKDKVMAALDEARKKLGVSELEGYQRMGINPYSGESYLKYYDPKTGELVIGEIRALYKNLDQVQKDFQQSCDRARVEAADISKSYQEVLDKYRATRDAKQQKDDSIYQLAKAQEDLNRAKAQAAAAEAERQALENRPQRPTNVLP
jgi:hypothetical protein